MIPVTRRPRHRPRSWQGMRPGKLSGIDWILLMKKIWRTSKPPETSQTLVRISYAIFTWPGAFRSTKRATNLPGEDTYLERVSRAPNKTPHIHRNGQSRAAEIFYFCYLPKTRTQKGQTNRCYIMLWIESRFVADMTCFQELPNPMEGWSPFLSLAKVYRR